MGLKSSEICARLQKLGSKEKARLLQGFFKTGPGGYAEGDIFIGLTVPEIRMISKDYPLLPEPELISLLQSPLHEARLLALFLFIQRFETGDGAQKKSIYELYLQNTKYINNWDLVDASADRILGSYLAHKKRDPLFSLATSNLLWERRISIIATFHFIKSGDFKDALRISRLLLHDTEDLIHKAVGWMLREIGKRNQSAEEEFLRSCYQSMPRTMLRYSIERFPEKLRQDYLHGRM